MHCRGCGYELSAAARRTRRGVCQECGRENPYLVRTEAGASRTLPDGRLRVRAAYNPQPRRGGIPFAFESFDHPAVRALAAEHNPAAALAGQPDEIHAQMALVNWHNRRLLSGGPAIEVHHQRRWRRAFSPRRGFEATLLDADTLACSGFTFNLVQLFSCVGHVARVVNVTAEDTPYGKRSAPHMIVEVWSNQYVQWAVMDGLFNHSYWKGDRPLSALQARDELFRNGGRDVRTLWGLSGRAVPRRDELGSAAGHPRQFAWVLYYTANNFRAFPVRHKLWRAVLYRDRQNRGRPLTIWPGGTHRPYAGEGMLIETENRDDFDWPLNLVEMNLTAGGGARLHVNLQTVTPNLSHFEARRGRGAWRRVAADFDWPLRPGPNRLASRAVNTLGVCGHESFVELDWEPKP